jgi:hypothetical protein
VGASSDIEWDMVTAWTVRSRGADGNAAPA